jgi:hypothetical protein
MTLSSLSRVVLCSAALASTAALAQNPPTGVVYGCYSSSASGPSFTLVDGSTYKSRQGASGHYKYDGGSGVLTILDGPYKDIRYLKVSSAFSFRVLRGDTMEMSTISCPVNVGKDPNKRPW